MNPCLLWKSFPIKIEKQENIPAVTHVDGSGRLQTVDKDISPRYYQLIDTFRKTGVPILLNTSFNENEPIVNSPAEAGLLFTHQYGYAGNGKLPGRKIIFFYIFFIFVNSILSGILFFLYSLNEEAVYNYSYL